MTTNPNPQPGESAEPVAKTLPTVVEFVTARRCFPTLAAAGAALAAIANGTRDFDARMIVAPGASFSDEGEFVPEAPEWTADSHEIMLAPLSTKAVKDRDGNETKPAKLIALVLAPIPTVDAASADDNGMTALVDVWRKEMNHRAVRKLRNAENVHAAATEMPLSLESYVTSSEAGPSGLAAFDDHWLVYSQGMSKKVPQWAMRFPGGKGKAAIRSAIENSARAKALFPELEGFAGGSLFVRLLMAVTKRATTAGQDVTLLNAWLETRDAQTYEIGEATSTDVDLDAMFADMDAEPATEAGDDNDDGDPPTGTDATAEAEATE